jgi:prepilin-type N-terminal cleavage/methylation domain-containing protein
LPQPRLSDADGGFTLIETLVALVIMGIAVTGIIGGYVTATAGTTSHQSDARAAAVLVNAVEQLRAATYVNCATTSTPSYKTALASATLPSAWASSTPTVVMTSVRYWNGSGFSATCDPTTEATLTSCSGVASGAEVAGSMQLIAVSVTSPDNKATDSLTFVKRLVKTC